MTLWTVSVANMGALSQCSGVAKILDEDFQKKIVVPRQGLARFFQKPVFNSNEAAPDIIVSCGSEAEPHVIKMKLAYSGRPIAVHLQHPRIDGYDMVFVSRHDWKTEFEARPNYHQMVGVPHRFIPEMWQDLREAARARYAPNNEQVAVVLIGGANGAYAYDRQSLTTIFEAIQNQVQAGWTVLLSVSRRTNSDIRASFRTLQSDRVIIWEGEGHNPYVEYLAAADAFLIAKDSVTMPSEALSTGKPVYSLDLSKVPGRKLQKFERFHTDMQETLRLTRPYLGSLEHYDYTVPNEAKRIASLVRSNSLHQAKSSFLFSRR
ncbi:mitochondrial fission ELM1 family protein [Falsirhodobacter sp. 20TX0035]|uniref:mitochondrial fission ELM1 family protein n=1 Tax=Falsirhodobacter sp. 20TX0035 TaxID=3022019 RepID=UPI00232F4BF1|nr:mitochondrial fission ELM1 family protein [Falsirhodobacter sp. 20TX0035]MDB6454833.1 mitochondrial fission ELM1 family protein [Falsirhodobacter sp. 20TX0035]